MLADAGALATSGYQKTSGVLNLLKGFDSESEFVVWNEIVARLGAIRAAWVFEDEAITEGLKAFQLALVGPKAHKMGWEFSDKDGHIEQQFKAMLFENAGLSGDQKIIDASKDMFNRFMDGDKAAIHPNIRKSVFAIALRYGGTNEVRFSKLMPLSNAQELFPC
jgi:aminopeptidase 2